MTIRSSLDRNRERPNVIVIIAWLVASVALCLVLTLDAGWSIRSAAQAVSGGTLGVLGLLALAGIIFLRSREMVGLVAVGIRFDRQGADAVSMLKTSLQRFGEVHEVSRNQDVILSCISARSRRSWGEHIVAIWSEADGFLLASWSTQPTFTYGKNRSNLRRILRDIRPYSEERLGRRESRARVRDVAEDLGLFASA